MKIQQFLFTILFTTIGFTALSQRDLKEGFIVLNSQDTIRGFIDLRSNVLNSKDCLFKQSKEDKITAYSPTEIIAYRIGNEKLYVSKKVVIDDVSQTVFLECLVDGVLDLFYLKLTEREKYFIEHPDGSLNELDNETTIIKREGTRYYKPSNRYKGVMTYTFQDSPEVVEKIKKTSFAHRDLINITKDYHNATCDYDCMIYGKTGGSTFSIEPFVGIKTSNQRIKNATGSAKDQNYIVGVHFRLQPEKNQLRSFGFGLTYSSNEFEEVYSIVESVGFNQVTRNVRIRSSYSLMSLPLFMEYNLTTKKIVPFFQLGLEPSLYTKVNHNTESSLYQVFASSGVFETPRREVRYTKLQVGAFAGLGLKFKLYQSNAKLTLQYAYREPAKQFNQNYGFHYVSEWRLVFGVGIKSKKD